MLRKRTQKMKLILLIVAVTASQAMAQQYLRTTRHSDTSCSESSVTTVNFIKLTPLEELERCDTNSNDVCRSGLGPFHSKQACADQIVYPNNQTNYLVSTLAYKGEDCPVAARNMSKALLADGSCVQDSIDSSFRISCSSEADYVYEACMGTSCKTCVRSNSLPPGAFGREVEAINNGTGCQKVLKSMCTRGSGFADVDEGTESPDQEDNNDACSDKKYTEEGGCSEKYIEEGKYDEMEDDAVVGQPSGGVQIQMITENIFRNVAIVILAIM